MKIADKKDEVCENKDCKYCSNTLNLCRFGLRDIGCYMENDTVSGMATDFLKTVEKGLNPETEV